MTGESKRQKGLFDLPDVLKILYKALVQSIEDPFRILDTDYRLLWINRSEPCQEIGLNVIRV